MASVEDKIVKLSMDNKDLVGKAKESTSIMSKLLSVFKKSDSVNMDKSVKSMNDLNQASKGVTLESLLNAVQNVGGKFSALGVVAATVLSNITNRAVDAGMKMVNALSVKPMVDGFQEYELKMGSIQTILANTSRHGTTLKQVSDNLDELNTYADKTIYNFGDMTRNIGLFTNAGIKIEDATSMIKGFSNEAATSGTTAQQAAGAAYQLSQALSAGTIRLMDWRSLQNVGMGNKNMQDGLVQIAEAMGMFTDETTTANEVSKDFNGSLEKGWLSADVMQNYLKIQAGDLSNEQMKALGLTEKQITAFQKQQKTAEEAATKVRTFTQLIDTIGEALGSGWTDSWTTIIGDFNEASELWTSVNDVVDDMIGKSADARNTFLKDLVELGARKDVIDALGNSFKFILQIVNLVKGAFNNVFPRKSVQEIYDMINAFKEWTEGLQMSSETAIKVKNIFKGIFSLFSIGIKIVKAIGKAFLDMLPDNLGSGILDLLSNLGELIYEFDKGLTPTNAFTDILGKLSGAVKDVLTYITDLPSLLELMINGFKKGASWIGDKFVDGFKKIKPNLEKVFESFDMSKALDIGLVASIFFAIKKIMDKFEEFTGSFSGLFDSIKDGVAGLGGLTDVLDNMSNAINIGSIMMIGSAVLMIAGAMKIISTIDTVDIFKSLQVLTSALVGVGAAIFAIGKLNMNGSFKAAFMIVTLSSALVILSIALKIMSTIDPDGMATALMGLVGTLTMLTAAMVILDKTTSGMGPSMFSMIGISTAILILSTSLLILSKIPVEDAIQGLLVMAGIFAELAVFMIVVDKFGKTSMATAISIGIISGAILVMSGAVALLGMLPTDNIVKGLLALTGILAAVAIFVKFVNGGASTMVAAVSMTVLAAAIALMVPSFILLGTLSMGTIAKGLIALGGALAIMVAALKLATGSLAGAAALIVAAGAIALFAPAVMMLGQLSLGQVAIALIAIAGAFGIVAAAGLLLGPSALAIIPFALAIGAMGLAIGAIGLVLSGFAAALTALASMTVSSVASIIENLSALLLGLISLVPEMQELGVAMILGFLNGIREVIPEAVDTALSVILAILEKMRDNVPQIVEVGADLVIRLMGVLEEKTPELVQAGVEMIISLINGLANAVRDNQEALVLAILNLIGSILELIVTALEELVVTFLGWVPGVEEAARSMGDAARGGLRDMFNRETTKQDGDEGAAGFVEGVDGQSGNANTAGANVASNAKSGLGSQDSSQEGINLGAIFNNGLEDQSGNANTAGANVASNAKSGLGSQDSSQEGIDIGKIFSNGLEQMGNHANVAGQNVAAEAGEGLAEREDDAGIYGGNFSIGFANGINNNAHYADTAGSSLGSIAAGALRAALSIFSPSRLTRKYGGYFDEGFTLGIEDGYTDVEKASMGLADSAISGLDGVSDELNSRLNGLVDMNPVIKPTLDMSNVTGFDMSKYIPLTFGANAQMAGGTSGPVTININGNNKDPRVLAREIERIIVRG